jgi:NADH-quinone oxidoreductase subunit J
MAIAFWILAVLCVGSALGVILLRDVFRAALFLVLSFFTVAGLYITLNADFLAAVQVLIYVGAIAVLLIFAIMLTREAPRGNPMGFLRVPALIIALLLAGSLIYAVFSTQWEDISGVSEKMTHPVGPTTQHIATALFSEGGFVLPLEIAAILLLAAVIGAIVLVRER